MVAMAYSPSHGMFQKSGHSRRQMFDGAIYMPVLHQGMALHSISSLSEPLHSCPANLRLYIASFVLRVYVVQTWEFFLALGHENMPVQASIRY